MEKNGKSYEQNSIWEASISEEKDICIKNNAGTFLGRLLSLVAFMCVFFYLFYPQQQMPVGQLVFITTPDSPKYHNDCLHPCVREVNKDSFVMVLSPYYAWDSAVEKPIVYFSSSLTDWGNGTLLADIPVTGYNSDPTVFVDDSLVYVFWRECDTPTSKDNGAHEVVVGNSIKGNKPTITERNEYLTNSYDGVDVTQCPILLKHDGKYIFYAVWYQYEPGRKNKGIAIWEGFSLDNPFFLAIRYHTFQQSVGLRQTVSEKDWAQDLLYPFS